MKQPSRVLALSCAALLAPGWRDPEMRMHSH
jgi:hypothetical protein